jgi:hypothetical protein
MFMIAVMPEVLASWKFSGAFSRRIWKTGPGVVALSFHAQEARLPVRSLGGVDVLWSGPV